MTLLKKGQCRSFGVFVVQWSAVRWGRCSQVGDIQGKYVSLFTSRDVIIDVLPYLLRLSVNFCDVFSKIQNEFSFVYFENLNESNFTI